MRAPACPAYESAGDACKRLTALTAATLGSQLAARAQAETAWPAFIAALRRAENAGYDPADALTRTATARELRTARNVSEVLAWRINRHLAAHSGAPASAGTTANDIAIATANATLTTTESTPADGHDRAPTGQAAADGPLAAALLPWVPGPALGCLPGGGAGPRSRATLRRWPACSPRQPAGARVRVRVRVRSRRAALLGTAAPTAGGSSPEPSVPDELAPAFSSTSQVMASAMHAPVMPVSGGQTSRGWLSRMIRSNVDPERLAVRMNTGELSGSEDAGRNRSAPTSAGSDGRPSWPRCCGMVPAFHNATPPATTRSPQGKGSVPDR